MRCLVTGGAGFIGSHFVDRLMNEGNHVRVVDSLSGGSTENIKAWLGNPRFELVQADLKSSGAAEKAMHGIETVFHLAANPEVRVYLAEPDAHFNENLLVTFNVLNAMRKTGAKTIVFSSTSTVYGEPGVIPTPEGYGPLEPISVYGASKLGCEAMISAYCHTFGIRGLVLRLANIVGARSNHGVIADFVKKLKSDLNQLEILGDGSQDKSYLHVSDCVDAALLALEKFQESTSSLEVYNIGSMDKVNVKRIAQIVVEEMGLENVRFVFTGGVDGGRGWKGDVKTMLLSTEKLSRIGWAPKYASEQAVRQACRELLQVQ